MLIQHNNREFLTFTGSGSYRDSILNITDLSMTKWHFGGYSIANYSEVSSVEFVFFKLVNKLLQQLNNVPPFTVIAISITYLKSSLKKEISFKVALVLILILISHFY